MNNHAIDLKQDQMPFESPKDFRYNLNAQRVYALSVETKPGHQNVSSARGGSRAEGGSEDSGVRREPRSAHASVRSGHMFFSLSHSVSIHSTAMSWHLRVQGQRQ